MARLAWGSKFRLRLALCYGKVEVIFFSSSDICRPRSHKIALPLTSRCPLPRSKNG